LRPLQGALPACAPAARLAKAAGYDRQHAQLRTRQDFRPRRIEAKWYAHWETNGLFRPSARMPQPFTIVNPPPNVTGSLHIGHALDNTLQDVVIRYERLRGKDALWVVGTDHAGIATQMVVERQLEAKAGQAHQLQPRSVHRQGVGMEGESGGTITRQLRRLGCSMDWSASSSPWTRTSPARW
jgi:valyl-tRNA synthetase